MKGRVQKKSMEISILSLTPPLKYGKWYFIFIKSRPLFSGWIEDTKKKNAERVWAPPYGNFHTFFFEPFPYLILIYHTVFAKLPLILHQTIKPFLPPYQLLILVIHGPGPWSLLFHLCVLCHPSHPQSLFISGQLGSSLVIPGNHLGSPMIIIPHPIHSHPLVS